MKSVVIEYDDCVERQLWKIPLHIELKLFVWAKAVEAQGLEVVRQIPGYHDEPLKGDRLGQRSIRLNRSYRAIYEVTETISAKIIKVKEVTKHDY